jgi:hypothetical protein
MIFDNQGLMLTNFYLILPSTDGYYSVVAIADGVHKLWLEDLSDTTIMRAFKGCRLPVIWI